MLARTVLFLPFPIVMAMFPRAVVSGKKKLVLVPIGLSFVVSVSAAVFISIFPHIPMRLMYGVDDALHLHLVRLYVWAAIPLSLAMIGTHLPPS